MCCTHCNSAAFLSVFTSGNQPFVSMGNLCALKEPQQSKFTRPQQGCFLCGETQLLHVLTITRSEASHHHAAARLSAGILCCTHYKSAASLCVFTSGNQPFSSKGNLCALKNPQQVCQTPPRAPTCGETQILHALIKKSIRSFPC